MFSRELVIGVEAVRLHGAITVFDMVGQTHSHRRGRAALLASALQRQAHGIGVRHTALDRIAHRRLEFSAAIAIEQAQQRGSDGAQILATLSGTDEQLPAGGGGVRSERRPSVAVVDGLIDRNRVTSEIVWESAR